MCKSALIVLNELLRRIINCKRGDTNLKIGDKIANEEIKQSEMYVYHVHNIKAKFQNKLLLYVCSNNKKNTSN